MYEVLQYVLTFSFGFRLITLILTALKLEGLDVKALRAFRVLRPLRLVSGVPSTLPFLLE